jgi:hypothetical protein
MPSVKMRDLGTKRRPGEGYMNPGGGQKPPYMVGSGDTDYICAGCDVVLLSHIQTGQIRGMVWLHPACGHFSATD